MHIAHLHLRQRGQLTHVIRVTTRRVLLEEWELLLRLLIHLLPVVVTVDQLDL